MGAFDELVKQRTVVVTTYKRDGSGVPTPGKAKRLRRDTQVLIGPSTIRGKPTGPSIAATARLLEPDEEEPTKQALAKKHPLMHGLIVPLTHRLRRYTTVHYELTAS